MASHTNPSQRNVPHGAGSSHGDPAARRDPGRKETMSFTQTGDGVGPSQDPRRKKQPTLHERLTQHETQFQSFAEAILERLAEMQRRLDGNPQQPTAPQVPPVEGVRVARVETINQQRVDVASSMETTPHRRVAEDDRSGRKQRIADGKRRANESGGGSEGGRDRASNTRQRGEERVEESQSFSSSSDGSTDHHPRRLSQKEKDKRDAKSFHQQRPPSFSGGDSTAAEDWLLAINKILDFVGCSDRQKVIFAAFQLEGDAYRWWETQKRIFESKQEEITWRRFTRIFFEKFFPPTVRIAKTREFTNLRQGSMSVVEYETKFSSLTRFATYLVADEDALIRRFQNGLNGFIWNTVMAEPCEKYGKVVDRAMWVEK